MLGRQVMTPTLRGVVKAPAKEQDKEADKVEVKEAVKVAVKEAAKAAAKAADKAKVKAAAKAATTGAVKRATKAAVNPILSINQRSRQTINRKSQSQINPPPATAVPRKLQSRRQNPQSRNASVRDIPTVRGMRGKLRRWSEGELSSQHARVILTGWLGKESPVKLSDIRL